MTLKFHQHKIAFVIDNMINNKIVVSNKISLVKRILLAIKMLKKLDLYAYSFRPECI